ncbi:MULTISPECIES: YjjG family noncanonical pyrimidine nucleotidase [unclassified Clostridium]|uniref:YjjG family noncanonical pyrimidine nucleotidase n=1 Tax=Clostridium TaxID=1485 RepID=UPI001C8BBAE3|nr:MULTISPECIES: YjjG family noncanonical pyrimidine nucleotidase [unclassified Clostridium]MBX9137213.1 noncanonical pyrimidine nucleotidase, YjjG family [Clostridium sp. K12(2020)]MBX9143936.1 noncanonical pyrimidine nucleotidase, YjjG family [Clostridium sp. K13]MDU4324658.1 YjjG family noncanonical pyrimidine nucleotidase [Clostridium celatum]
MKYKVILFDADETLFDFKKAEKEAFKNSMLELDIEYDENYHFATYKEINTAIWKELEEGLITQEKLKTERFKRLIDKLDMTFDENDFANIYMTHLGNGSFLFDGAMELIEDLSSKYILSIVTNGLTSVQERRLKKSTIAKHFKDIVISESIGISKPHPDIFEHAINNLGTFNKDEVLMIGDNLNSDIRGGINYNIDTCWYNPNKLENKTDLKPTYEICDYTELRRLLLDK